MISCFNYSKLSINLLSFSISIFILLLVELFNSINLEISLATVRENAEVNLISEKIKINNLGEWKIEIPKINLSANIQEGTTKEVLDFFVGHFEETSKISGNIGLASHNRGYNVNYFENIKELEIGDEIYYTFSNKTRIFEVETKTIIEETDWSMLENTEENKLTLITCVENMPEYRRCIQAVEREEIK
ncbi:MAG: class D sortase [Candidatus Scatovivens sp.]